MEKAKTMKKKGKGRKTEEERKKERKKERKI